MIFGGDGSMPEVILLRVACPDEDSACAIAKAALEARLIACANLSQVESLYRWQGKVETDRETVSVMKTRPEQLEPLCALIKKLHPYDLPAITWSTAEATEETAAWLRAQTTQPG